MSEFEEKLRTDEAFARDANQRLAFFYRRSPHFDQRLNLYPVARIGSKDEVAALPLQP